MAEKIIEERMTVMLLGSGHAAVHMVLVKDDKGEYWDVQQTGIGRYRTRAEAVPEALSWSMSDEIPLDAELQKEKENRHANPSN